MSISNSLIKSKAKFHNAIKITSSRYYCNNYKLFDATDLEINSQYRLEYIDNILQLSFLNLTQNEKPFRIDFSSYIERCKIGGNPKSELVYKAIGYSSSQNRSQLSSHIVVDFTAGLGRDSTILALCGFQRVIMFEKNEILYQLLQDGLKQYKIKNEDLSKRNQQHENAAKKMKNMPSDSLLNSLYLYNIDSTDISSIHKIFTNHVNVNHFDVNISNDSNTNSSNNKTDVSVYLDPMYPAGFVGKKSMVKKETQILHRLIGKHDNDNEEDNEQNNKKLFLNAINIATSKIVVKRPLKAKPLLDIKPHSVIEGSTQRFDIYFKNRPIKFDQL